MLTNKAYYFLELINEINIELFWGWFLWNFKFYLIVRSYIDFIYLTWAYIAKYSPCQKIGESKRGNVPEVKFSQFIYVC